MSEVLVDTMLGDGTEGTVGGRVDCAVAESVERGDGAAFSRPTRHAQLCSVGMTASYRLPLPRTG